MKKTIFLLLGLWGWLFAGGSPLLPPAGPAADPDTSAAFFTYRDQGHGKVYFRDASSSAPTAWLWDFGDGTSSTEQHPAHQYRKNGAYQACLTVHYNDLPDQYCRKISVRMPPVAAFSYTNLGNGLVAFQDLSENDPLSWSWDFDDGRHGTEQHPEHSYHAPGSYDVRLVAINREGANEIVQAVKVTLTATDLPGDRRMWVFPNLVHTWLSLQLDRTVARPFYVRFINTSGQMMREVPVQGEMMLNLTQWPEGFYTYEIYDHQYNRVGGGRISVIHEGVMPIDM